MKNNKFLVLAGVILAMLLSSLDQTIVATAMPRIVRELNGMERLSWVFTAYMLASTVTVPIYGKLSDLMGRRGFYIVGILIFLLGSILSGMATDMNQLILFRGLQGIGGGAMMVNSIAIIGDVFPPAERGKWQGLIGGIFGIASIGGPLLGGWITDNFSWRWVFYVNIPVGILAIIVLLYALPRIPHGNRRYSIDYAGAFFITLGLVPLLLALVWGGSLYDWNSAMIISLLALAILMIAAFIYRESKAAEPILSLKLFKNNVFTVSVITMFLTAMGMFGAIMYIPIFAQGVTGVSATHSGLILAPMMIALIVASSIAGQIISKTGKYKWLAVMGMIITVAGMYMFSNIGLDTKNTGLTLRMILLGIGLGSTMPIFTIAVQSAFGREKLGEVTAGTQLFRSIGGTVGTAILGGIMNNRLTMKLPDIASDPFVQGMQKMAPHGAAFSKINANTVQAVLSPDVQMKIKAGLAKLPQPMQTMATGNFNSFLNRIKEAFSYAVDHTFLVGTILMIGALISVFFLPEIELRRTQKPAIEKAGLEVGSEFMQSDEQNEFEI
jgi:EmrB/QacA subfamily drug resistance transporter